MPSTPNEGLPRSEHAWSACARFVLASLALLGASRVLLVALHARRVSDRNGYADVLLGGLRIDLSLVAVLVAGPLLLAPWFGGAQRGARLYQRAQAVYFACALLLISVLEAATPAFIAEYGFRPNRLFFEYLGSPRELLATLWSAYRVPLLASLAAGVGAIWIARALFRVRPARALRWWLRAPASALAFGLCLLAARSGFQHRPINPASVAFCDDPLLNSLALNSLYNVGFALYRLKDEADASLVYGRMPLEEMHARVRAAAGLTGAPADAQRPSVHHQVPALKRARPVHLVVIVEESLGARYVGALGGADLTPELDAMAEQSWWFERMYATGTRSARGLEAISAGFLPSPARAVLKLDRAQGGFFTLAALLREHGYHARFVYGGEGQFDNMQGFFLANGFHEAIDGGDFESPRFVGSWGVSDEDVLERVHQELLADGERPSFTLAFSVSNHTPYDYPSGRIEHGDGPAATQENAIRYADWALGDFFAKARAAPYWERTIVAVIADHDSRVYGADLVPLERFHIPALIVGPDVPVRRDTRLVSQIDLGPTLLSLLGLDCAHPMLGRDLLSLPAAEPGRAVMQYEENHAYWSGSRVVIHQPHKPAQQFRTDGVQLVPMELDLDFARTALAHALWASWAYREQRYGLPPQPAARVALR